MAGPAHDMNEPLDCFFHGKEVIPHDCFIVCGECGHAWTRTALEAADRQLFGTIGDHTSRKAEQIFSCPLCVHDF